MSTPDIKPFLQRAIDQNRSRWDENTYDSCRDILQATLRLAGAEWAFVGKTADADGPSVQPPGFVPFDANLIRPDGQRQTVRIVGVSHDAAWHVPSGRQVKVIVNSAANSDERPEIHGPARIGGEIIPTQNYRWHNCPVAQIGVGSVPQPPPPSPSSSTPGVLPKGVALIGLTAINDFYASPTGLNRPGGMIDEHGKVDLHAVSQWFYQFVIEGVPLADVISKIRQSQEWRDKHPGETP